jgi:hypothetical protein
MKRLTIVVIFLIVVSGDIYGQDAATPTPLQINLVTPTPPVLNIETSPTPTWTATPAALAILEAIDVANVRASPDIEGALLGQIRSGETYTVSGRYFEWYQFQFDRSPNGRGWVFGQLVRITGDPGTIPELADQPLPTTDPLIVAATQAVDALLQTPGGALTATEAARGIVSTIQIPGVVGSGRATEAPSEPLLPTFTFPPGIVRVTAVNEEGGTEADEPALELTGTSLATIPPLVPILVLGVLGVIGLILSGSGRR